MTTGLGRGQAARPGLVLDGETATTKEEPVELGVQGLNAKATLNPAVTRRIARRAEELGYTSWWAGEHVVLPSPRTAESPMDPKDPVLDPLVHLSYVAACTEVMELGTAVVILPQRNP